MNKLESPEIAEVVTDFLTNNTLPVALFAGSGVGVHAGLPDWSHYLEMLAQVADKYEKPIGDLMRSRIASKNLSMAATYYKTCQMPRGELYRQMVVPLENPPSISNLDALCSLPFSAAVTTNFDRALHHSFASVIKKAPATVELNDPTMAKATFYSTFYIARVHGRIEVPETMVLSDDDYSQLQQNNAYLDFLRHIFTRYSVLFLGFSFLDPAIKHVFSILEERLGTNLPALHLAILPVDADPLLVDHLTKLNIRVVGYNNDLDHVALWDGIKDASRGFSLPTKANKPDAVFSLESIKRFVATSYTRLVLEDELQPLREIVIDGILLDVLGKRAATNATLEQLAAELRQVLQLPIAQSRLITRRRIEVLSGRGWCRVDGASITLSRQLPQQLTSDLSVLIKGVVDRAIVREGLRPDPGIDIIIGQCIEDVLVARSWDLGAQFAGAARGELPGLRQTIALSLGNRSADLSISTREKITEAFLDLFQNPNESEGRVLAQLGRTAFALQLVIGQPCSTLAYEATLPEKVYLDASFLMPAIVKGHPLNQLYSSTLNRLREASTNGRQSVKIVALFDFLNEIVSHRRRAIEEVRRSGAEDIGTLRNSTLFLKPENLNVFIAAYQDHLSQKSAGLRFERFLGQIAPYGSEEQLSQYLDPLGITGVRVRHDDPEMASRIQRIKPALETGYNEDPKSRFSPKEDILLAHEIHQIAQLSLDLARNTRSLFVTSDARLRGLLVGPELSAAGRATVTHRGLIQLLDLLVGLKSDPVIMAKLLWASVVTDETTMIRDYLIHLAIRWRDELMNRALHDMVDDFSRTSAEKAKRENINLFPGGSIEDRVKRNGFLDTLENDFYSSMAEVFTEKFPEEYNYPLQLRRDKLKEHITNTYALIGEYETALRESSDPKEKANCESQIRELRARLNEYKKELEGLPETRHRQ